MKRSFASPIGKLLITVEDFGVVGIEFSDKEADDKHVLLDECCRQLDEYFRGMRKEFDLPLSFEGTSFQEKVWNALLGIPYGEVRTYKDIAVSIGEPKACRAVGGANNRNKIAIVIPCHRVVASNGMGGYACGVDVKEWLLKHEQ